MFAMIRRAIALAMACSLVLGINLKKAGSRSRLFSATASIALQSRLPRSIAGEFEWLCTSESLDFTS